MADRKDIWKDGFTVEPGEDGSFMLMLGGRTHWQSRNISLHWNFTTIADMMRWLQEQADAFERSRKIGDAG